ncbi:MAG TPA: hypothetical protein VHY20_11485 [Pirellulales bacterium]|nr:hypothetical protein [Pirellulales bacterium]
MSRMIQTALLIALAAAGPAQAFEIQAKIKQVDTERRTVVFITGDSERTVKIGEEVQVLGRDGQPLAEGIKSPQLTAGSAVNISFDRQGDRRVMTAIRLRAQSDVGQFAAGKPPAIGQSNPPPARAAESAHPPSSADTQTPSAVDTSHLVPLSDMGGSTKYQGFAGGLYPEGSNVRPTAHEQAGLELAKTMQPLDANGQPQSAGKIGLLTVGFSNTLQCSRGFIEVAAEDKSINPHVVIVNGAQGGRSAFMTQNPKDGAVGEQYWNKIVDQLRAAGLTPAQVQVVWLKQTDANLNPGMLKNMHLPAYDSPLLQGFPKGQQTYEAELKQIVRVIHTLFPQVRLTYVSSRSYGGWTSHGGNSEPWSYETGFGVKWLIEAQLKGEADLNFDPAKGAVAAPWLSWGPYLWANGAKPRGDGLTVVYEDYSDKDHMHHSPQGIRKMGQRLVDFFKTDATTKTWFLAPGA